MHHAMVIHDQVAQFTESMGHIFKHAAGIIQFRLLRQIGHAHAAVAPYLARIRRCQPRNQLEQGRFAGAVAPDYACALAPFQAETRVFQ